MNKKEIIINRLLDKYEKSKSFQGNSNRRIILKMKEVKEYNIEDYEEKEQFHNVIKELKAKEIISDFSWEKFEIGNILKEVWLNKENVEKAYSEIERNDIKQEARQVIKQLNSYQFSEKWLNQFRQDMLLYCEENQKAPNLLPYTYSKNILEALANLTPEQEILKRVFSVKCYGDSKYFENSIENYLVRIIKRYLIEDDETVSNNEELLLQVGIAKAPEIIEFSGNLEGTLNDEKITYTIDTKGSYMNSYTIKKIENLKLKNVNKVIWIENKTNYLDYILNQQEPDEFVIYHGGMYSPTKGYFFKKLYLVIDKEVKFYHWSDIDIGGFKIFTRLKSEIVRELEPYHMTKEDLEKMKKYWKPISEQYKKELENMYKMDKYLIFKEVISFMIANECKLEQESFILHV